MWGYRFAALYGIPKAAGSRVLPMRPDHRHNRCDIRQHQKDLVRNIETHGLKPKLEGLGSTEEKGGSQRPKRIQATEDDDRQCDEPSAGDHVVVEQVESAQRKVGSA